MTQTPYALRYDFRGGINNTLPDEMIADGEIADAQNYIPNPSGRGLLIKRPGYASHFAGVTDKTVTAMFSGKLNRYYTGYHTGTAKDFLIYDLDDGTELYSETTPANEPYFGSLNGVDYCVTGSHELKTTDGTTWSAWSGPFTDSALSLPCILATYNNMLWGMARAGPPCTLGWSAVGNGDTWSATQTLALDTGATNSNYNPGSALIPFRDRLIVFSTESMFHIQAFGVTDVTIPFSRRDIGCIGPRAAVESPFGLIWWSSVHGIVISPDGYAIQMPMQEKLKSTFTTIQSYQGTGIHAVWRPDLLCARFFVPTTAATKYLTRIDYYPAQNAFWIQNLSTGFANGVSASLVVTDNSFSSGDVQEYVSAGIAIYKEGTGAQDNLQTPSAYLTTKRQVYMTASVSKNARHALLTTKMATSAALTYEVFADNATTATQSFSVTPATGVVDTDIGINQECRKIQHKITDANNARNELYCLTETGYVDQDVV